MPNVTPRRDRQVERTNFAPRRDRRFALTHFLLFLFLAGPLLAQPRPKILGLARASFYVTDIAKARAFYEDFLGYQSLPMAGRANVAAYIKINDKQYVELLAGPNPGDRLHSTAVYTDNAEQMRAYLAAKGISVPAKIGRDGMGNPAFAVQDPDNHKIEFVEYNKDARDVDARFQTSRISSRLSHAGINVGSLNRAMKFYHDILGFEETWRGGAGPQLSWVNLRVPNGEDYIEFMLYDTLPAENQRGGRHHICLVVPDMTKAAATLEARPARKTYTLKLEPKVGVNRKRQLNLFDPDGTRVELMEPSTIDGTRTPSSTAPPPIP